jgi:transcription initiation factor TFIIH subunit 1
VNSIDMAAPSGSALFKKKDGTLAVSKDHKSLSWIPAAGDAGGAVTVAVQNMTST